MLERASAAALRAPETGSSLNRAGSVRDATCGAALFVSRPIEVGALLIGRG